MTNKNLKVPSHCSCCLTNSFRNFALVDDDALSKITYVGNAYFSPRVTRESTYMRVYTVKVIVVLKLACSYPSILKTIVHSRTHHCLFSSFFRFQTNPRKFRKTAENRPHGFQNFSSVRFRFSKPKSSAQH